MGRAEEPTEQVTRKDAIDDLKRIVRKGLPITLANAGTVIIRFTSVAARAALPESHQSRVPALDAVLREVLDGLDDSDEAAATRILFALDPKYQGTTLTTRREDAADILGRSVDHFRQEIEPRLLGVVLEALLELNIRYRPRRPGAPPGRDIAGSLPGLSVEDVSEMEEVACRLWSAVYGFKAELIAAARSASNPHDQTRYALHRYAALWQTARILELNAQFLDRFGGTIREGEVPYAAEHLIRLAGWRPELSEQEASLLRYEFVRVNPEDSADLQRRLSRTKDGRRILARWTELMSEWTEASAMTEDGNR